jgi:hypothetical protein
MAVQVVTSLLGVSPSCPCDRNRLPGPAVRFFPIALESDPEHVMAMMLIRARHIVRLLAIPISLKQSEIVPYAILMPYWGYTDPILTSSIPLAPPR